jgi:hypothetical protein
MSVFSDYLRNRTRPDSVNNPDAEVADILASSLKELKVASADIAKMFRGERRRRFDALDLKLK